MSLNRRLKVIIYVAPPREEVGGCKSAWLWADKTRPSWAWKWRAKNEAQLGLENEAHPGLELRFFSSRMEGVPF